MSRQIDPENLSSDDVVYIQQRPSLRREFILQGFGDPLKEDYPGLADSEESEEEEGETPEDETSGSEGSEEPGEEDEDEEPEDEDIEPEDEPEDESDDFDEWKKAELQAEARKRGLSDGGNKPELINRLRGN